MDFGWGCSWNQSSMDTEGQPYSIHKRAVAFKSMACFSTTILPLALALCYLLFVFVPSSLDSP
jgi:hypothetical protein